MHPKRIFELIPLGIIAAMIGAAFFWYEKLPARIIMHWNTEGIADGWWDKDPAIWFWIGITFAIYLILSVIPKIAVFKDNIQHFIFQFWLIKTVLVAFFAMFFMMSLLAEFYVMPIMTFVVISMAVIFYMLGQVFVHIKRNFFVGIRTPWTLANDVVWRKTHIIGSYTFKINAFILLLGLVWPLLTWNIMFCSIIINIIFLVVYSYLIYRKESRVQLS